MSPRSTLYSLSINNIKIIELLCLTATKHQTEEFVKIL